MKKRIWIVLPLSLLATTLLAGCGSSDSTASADEEKMFKNPIKGTPPTADQMKSSGPAHVGAPSGSMSLGGGSGGGSAPPEAMKQPGSGGG